MRLGPRLKDLGRWSSGGTPPKDREDLWEGELPWVSAKDFDHDRLRESTTFITEEAGESHSRIAPPDSILLIVRGMALAHGLPVAQTSTRVAFNQDLRGLTVAPEFVPRFVYYALRGHRSRLNAHIDQAAHGTARLIDSVMTERVQAPGRESQQRVADFLDRECERIGALEDAARALQHEAVEPALARFAELTDAAPKGRVGYRYAVQLGKMLDSKRIDPDNVSPYLGNANVQWDRFALENLNEMTFSAGDRAKYALRPGDLLVCEGGDAGRAAIWRGELTGCFFQKALMRVRPYGRDSTRYLMWCLRSASMRGNFAAQGTGSAILHLPAERLTATRIPLPSPARQAEITAEVDAINARSSRLEGELHALQQSLHEYRDALITEAVTGKLDVTRLSEQQLDESAHAAREGERPEVLA